MTRLITCVIADKSLTHGLKFGQLRITDIHLSMYVKINDDLNICVQLALKMKRMKIKWRRLICTLIVFILEIFYWDHHVKGSLADTFYLRPDSLSLSDP